VLFVWLVVNANGVGNLSAVADPRIPCSEPFRIGRRSALKDQPESKEPDVRLMYFGVETNVLLAAKSFCCGAKGGIQPPTPAFFRLFAVGAFFPLF